MKKAVQNIDKTLYVRVGVCMQAFVYKSCTCVCVCVRALPGVPQPAEREMRRLPSSDIIASQPCSV